MPDDYLDRQEYCYWCGHYHDGETSSGGAPAAGCSDFDEYNTPEPPPLVTRPA